MTLSDPGSYYFGGFSALEDINQVRKPKKARKYICMIYAQCLDGIGGVAFFFSGNDYYKVFRLYEHTSIHF